MELIKYFFLLMFSGICYMSCQNSIEQQNKTNDISQNEKVPRNNHLIIQINEGKINIPGKLKSGWHKILFINSGTTEHNGQFLLLKNSKTLNDYISDFGKVIDTGEPRPDYAIRYGGASPTAPRDTITFYQYFEPGNYAIYDLFNLFNGLSETFIVTEDINDIELPSAAFEVELDEYSYKFNKSLISGIHWLKVRNIGDEPHEITIGKMASGKNELDLIEWSKTFQNAPPVVPFRSQGLGSLAPGLESYLMAEFDSGNFVFFSNVTAPDGRRQTEHGMVKIIAIE